MSGPPHANRPRRTVSAAGHSRALIVIDHERLQGAAWAEFHTARKRHDKAAGDLHRHEQIDVPAYESWLHRTFPIYITTLRELHQEVFIKGRQVQTVQAMAALTGRSPRKLWREQKDYEANPGASADDEAGFDDDPNDADRGRRASDGDGEDDDFFNDDDGATRQSRSHRGAAFESGSIPRAAARATRAAKDIYRRLVQRLHPDRGGEFTPARQRLWHEIQQAWAAGDVDWLSRLEIEWETANEILGPTSPLSRLRQAIEELHGARRDTERKLREYRSSAPWRFTLSEKKRPTLHRRTEENFQHDLAFLQRQLVHLNATIAAWETAPRPRRRPRPAWQRDDEE